RRVAEMRRRGGGWAFHNRPDGQVLEAEGMTVARSGDCTSTVQDMTGWGASKWSGDKQLFCKATRGGHVELTFPGSTRGTYRLNLYATCAPDYGILRFELDGREIGPRFDGFLYAV